MGKRELNVNLCVKLKEAVLKDHKHSTLPEEEHKPELL